MSTWTNVGTRAAPTPGSSGRRSFPWASRQLWLGQRLPARKRTLPRPVTAQPPAPCVVTRWILSRPETLTEIEQLRLKAVLANCPELDALIGHVRSFAHMLTSGRGSDSRSGSTPSAGRPSQSPHSRGRHRSGPRRRHRRPDPALELRRRRGTRQQDQDAQAPDVRPSRFQPATQAYCWPT